MTTMIPMIEANANVAFFAILALSAFANPFIAFFKKEK